MQLTLPPPGGIVLLSGSAVPLRSCSVNTDPRQSIMVSGPVTFYQSKIRKGGKVVTRLNLHLKFVPKSSVVAGFGSASSAVLKLCSVCSTYNPARPFIYYFVKATLLKFWAQTSLLTGITIHTVPNTI